MADEITEITAKLQLYARQLQEGKDTVSKLEGKLEAVQARLKNNHGVETLDEAKIFQATEEEKLAVLKQQLKKELDSLSVQLIAKN